MKAIAKWFGVTAILAWSIVVLAATQSGVSQDVLRVCAAKDETPFSKADGSGFENKIAEIVADELGRELQFVWADRPGIYLVPEYLKQNKCDAIMGVDAGDPRVATTDAYYRSSYVFVYPQDADVKVTDWDSPDLADMTRFAVSPYSPVEAKLREMGKWDNNLNFMYSLIGFKSRRNEYVRYDPRKLISAVTSGKADIAIVWGPEVARFIEGAAKPLTTKRVPDTRVGDEEVIFQYAQAMATRPGDEALRDALDRAAKARADDIRAVLDNEGFPMLGVGGTATAHNDTGE